MAEESTDEERAQPHEATPLLADVLQEGTGPNRCAAVCLYLLLFLQFLGTERFGIDSLGNGSSHSFDLDKTKFGAIKIIFGIIVYTLPVAAGILIDRNLGRRKAILFGLIIKIIGSITILSVDLVLFFSQTSLKHSDALFKFLLASYVTGGMFVFAGLCFIAPALLAFIAQQFSGSHASVFRWISWISALGVLANNVTTEGVKKLVHTHHLIDQVLLPTADLASIVVFIIGWKKYNNSDLEEGQKAWGEVVHIAKSHVFCFCYRRRSGENSYDSPSQMREYFQRRKIERLKLRKSALFVAILSCNAVAVLGFAAIMASFILLRHIWASGEPKDKIGNMKNYLYLTYMIGVPLIEGVLKLSDLTNRMNILRTVGSFRALGIGYVLGALATLSTGIVASVLMKYGPHSVSVYSAIPQALLCGLSLLTVLPLGFKVMFSEGNPALASVRLGFGTALEFLCLSLGATLWTFADTDSLKHIDYIYYIMTGIILGTTLVVFWPVTRWYQETKKVIIEKEAELQDLVEGGGGQTNQAEINRINPLNSLV